MLRNLILATSALLQEKTPNHQRHGGNGQTGAAEQLGKSWSRAWSAWPISHANSANFRDEARLPTFAVLAVIAAAYELVPEHGDFVAKAEKLLHAYLWSSFFTDLYGNSAASRAYADFKPVKDKHRAH